MDRGGHIIEFYGSQILEIFNGQDCKDNFSMAIIAMVNTQLTTRKDNFPSQWIRVYIWISS